MKMTLAALTLLMTSVAFAEEPLTIRCGSNGRSVLMTIAKNTSSKTSFRIQSGESDTRYLISSPQQGHNGDLLMSRETDNMTTTNVIADVSVVQSDSEVKKLKLTFQEIPAVEAVMTFSFDVKNKTFVLDVEANDPVAASGIRDAIDGRRELGDCVFFGALR